MARFLVTGGAGYIGSHCCVALATAGHDVVAIDNLCVGRREVVERIRSLLGLQLTFHEIDVRDRNMLNALFANETFDGVVHFAGLKSVGESMISPLDYYDNNVSGTIALLDVMRRHLVRKLVFSSSATVYGAASVSPISEGAALAPVSPYGRTKVFVEGILRDLAASDSQWRIGLLRYFNPVGAHESGVIGEDPKGVPNNLMPYVARVATGELEKLTVFGDDYPTVDGTGVRDFVHVMDLVDAHLAAFSYLDRNSGAHLWNIGTSRGHSVLELVQTFEQVSGVSIPRVVGARRPGDVASNFADASLAREQLGWSAQRDLNDMCADTWRWTQWQKVRSVSEAKLHSLNGVQSSVAGADQ